MRGSAGLALVFVSSVASAGVIGGDTISVQPGGPDGVSGGGLAAWAAADLGAAYVGGELAMGSYATPDDFGVSAHVLGGITSHLSKRVRLLADVGAGATQQVEYHLGLFGGKSGFEGVAWMPSTAMRLQLVGELGTIGETKVGLGLAGEARAGLFPDDDQIATMGFGVGLGVFFAR